jgi:hypothetical protein
MAAEEVLSTTPQIPPLMFPLGHAGPGRHPLLHVPQVCQSLTKF